MGHAFGVANRARRRLSQNERAPQAARGKSPSLGAYTDASSAKIRLLSLRRCQGSADATWAKHTHVHLMLHQVSCDVRFMLRRFLVLLAAAGLAIPTLRAAGYVCAPSAAGRHTMAQTAEPRRPMGGQARPVHDVTANAHADADGRTHASPCDQPCPPKSRCAADASCATLAVLTAMPAHADSPPQCEQASSSVEDAPSSRRPAPESPPPRA